MNINVQEYIDMGVELVINYTPKLILALLTIFIGFKIVKVIQRAIERIMERQKLDPMVEGFLSSLIGGILKVLVFISAAGILGVKTDSFVAMLAAAGLAIGMALSGTLQNFASGVMILLFKPFKIGDFVEVSGHSGVINEIQIFNTIMLTGDKKTVIIPNAQITGTSMINYSSQPKRRVDLEVGISYSDDIHLAKETLRELAEIDTRVIKSEVITTGVKALGDSAVIIAFRFFVHSDDYWDVFFDMNERIKTTFDEKGLNFPFPQRDVHMYNEKK